MFAKKTGPDVRGPLLFLSFDGVLHPFHDGTFSKLEALESLLREFPQVGLVFCSNWKESNEMEVLLGFFADDIANRVVGVTPHLPKATKQAEIESFLLTLPRGVVPWLAVDDDAALFRPGEERLISTRRETGLDPQSMAELREKLQGLSMG
jgi:hypothetical protein